MAYIVCDVCGKTGFKSKAGLAGHQKISHGVDKRRVGLDEVGKYLAEISQKFQLSFDFDKELGKRLAEMSQKVVDTSSFRELGEHLAEINKKMFSGSEFNEIGKRLSVLENEIRVLKEDLSPWIRELRNKYREHVK